MLINRREKVNFSQQHDWFTTNIIKQEAIRVEIEEERGKRESEKDKKETENI